MDCAFSSREVLQFKGNSWFQALVKWGSVDRAKVILLTWRGNRARNSMPLLLSAWAKQTYKMITQTVQRWRGGWLGEETSSLYSNTWTINAIPIFFSSWKLKFWKYLLEIIIFLFLFFIQFSLLFPVWLGDSVDELFIISPHDTHLPELWWKQ